MYIFGNLNFQLENYHGNLADHMNKSLTITCIAKAIEPASIQPEPSMPAWYPSYANRMNITFPIETIARIPMTKNGVQE